MTAWDPNWDPTHPEYDRAAKEGRTWKVRRMHSAADDTAGRDRMVAAGKAPSTVSPLSTF